MCKIFFFSALRAGWNLLRCWSWRLPENRRWYEPGGTRSGASRTLPLSLRSALFEIDKIIQPVWLALLYHQIFIHFDFAVSFSNIFRRLRHYHCYSSEDGD